MPPPISCLAPKALATAKAMVVLPMPLGPSRSHAETYGFATNAASIFFGRSTPAKASMVAGLYLLTNCITPPLVVPQLRLHSAGGCGNPRGSAACPASRAPCTRHHRYLGRCPG